MRTLFLFTRELFPEIVQHLPRGLGFGVRNASAALLALYFAFLTQMQEPQWAAMTVFIVAQGDRGMSLAKGKNRVAGTLVGASTAVVLVGAFAQAPELFLVTLGLWLAICTGTAAVVDGSRSYGVVLAGYTASIVGLSASSNPEQVFDIAIARTSEITLGILAEGLLAAVLSPGSARANLDKQAEQYLCRASELCANLIRGSATHIDTQRFVASALQLSQTAQYAAAASVEVAQSVGGVS